MILLQTPFVDVHLDTEKKLFKLIWKEATEDMSPNQFQEVLTRYAKELDQRGTCVLHEMSQMKFIVTPELQDWVDKNINKKAISVGITKAAIVVSPEIFTSISVQQSLNKENAKTATIAYFDNEAKAEEWILSQ